MLSTEKIDLIQKLFSEGKNRTEISKIVGVSVPTVGKYVGSKKVEEMIGKTFGQLIVLSRAEKRGDLASRCIRYNCQCSCGKIVEVNSNSLKTGHTTSCGCSRKGKNITNLLNKKFNHLLVIQELPERNKDRKVRWLCRCDCGTEVVMTGSQLAKANSCGCARMSRGEEKIESLLLELGVKYKKQYKFSNCCLERPLPFDFAVFDGESLVCLIEYQGDIHYKSTGGWNTEEELRLRRLRDDIKREYCKTNNIILIEIPYWEYENLNLNYLRKEILNGL